MSRLDRFVEVESRKLLAELHRSGRARLYSARELDERSGGIARQWPEAVQRVKIDGGTVRPSLGG